MEQIDTKGENSLPLIYPTLIKRFQSLMIDQFFIVACLFLLSQLFANTNEEEMGWIKGILWVSLFFVYEPLCMVLGCTLGNYIVGIRVRKIKNPTERINILQSYIRFVSKILLGTVSFFTVTADKQKRAIHDMIVDSVVIYNPKNK
ncbi:hypothetical protein AD998_06425 [bacterium 336/3]|nr:hypothetical protein AD998_06425 [bacterium 336/3]